MYGGGFEDYLTKKRLYCIQCITKQQAEAVKHGPWMKLRLSIHQFYVHGIP